MIVVILRFNNKKTSLGECYKMIFSIKPRIIFYPVIIDGALEGK
ncbi:recombinase A [Moritella sp. PE36]|nr:recombinase A [Moritella sp. PE36]